jgi:molybdopterin adenylyltransferase
MKIGRVTLSDRASSGVYADLSGPEIERVLREQFAEAVEFESVLLPDEQKQIENALKHLCRIGCALVVTTGGTGPAARDVTPEATRAVLEKELPGFGEMMRAVSFPKVPTAILSRATAGVRGKTLIVNLPGNPRAMAECLPPLMPAIAEAIDHLTGFRPALKPATVKGFTRTTRALNP